MQEVRDHLKPNGVISMYHYYLPVVVDRYADALTRVFGDPPCLELTAGSGPRPRTVLTASIRPGDLSCEERWSRPRELVAPVTDDHPFAYLVGSGIPGFYQVTLLAILLGSLVAVRLAAGPFAQMRPYVDLFFMGAAFLLLETKNVVQFALLFGTTWFVNALVFTGVLVAVLGAIEVAQRVRFRRPQLLYVALLASLVVAFAVPQAALLRLDVGLRFAVAVTLAFLPIFLANLVFAGRFRDVGSSTTAFGANLLGAMIGGLLEYASLITGYRLLLILVALLYGAAFLAGRRHLGAAPA
jgi:hypothetical protein